ncbi:amidohydrolase family protein [Bifidobacterium cuniculi]|uniref:Cytosine deaminase n=1 Tax=Bifidobacterium cuniculi TaxID=1688 RepID=A0A087AX72_9BIFI|nr:amidohydrolase [Bifidobacterium cuniculi]KFI63372.1 cytosine deaminase [Bifidobacterium cuniculi]
MNKSNTQYDLLITNATICTMNEDMQVIGRGFVAVTDDRIAMIGSGEPSSSMNASDVIDADGQVLFPGFINTHTHIFQSFLKGLGADHQLIEWLNRSALPYGAVMTPHQHRLAAQLTCMEAIRSGCTTLCEFFYTDQDPELADGCIAGMMDTGIRSVFIRTFQDRGEDYGMPACMVQPAEEAMREVERLRTEYRDHGDMLSIWTGPDVTWSTSAEGYRTMLDYCKAHDVRYAMHIDETEVDDAMCQATYDSDIVPMLEGMGFLGDHMLGVHCVNLTDDEIDAFARHGVSVSYNPVSNMYLGSGVAPIRECLDKGITVSIGTDGAASNNTTDFLEAMKFAALIQKGFSRDAARITARETVAMATVGGAKAIGMQQSLGSIEVGKKADMVLFEPRHLKSMPMHDPYATVVYSSSPENISTTIVNGKVVYRDGVFACGIDERQLSRDIDEELRKLRVALSLDEVQAC